MVKEVVHKASHCAWQIHYHIVFPVKYRRALMDEEVVKIITVSKAGKIAQGCEHPASTDFMPIWLIQPP